MNVFLAAPPSFQRVELEVARPGERLRRVSVHVGNGRTWLEAVRFPHLSGDGGEPTGDEALDDLIRRRAAEELCRLEATRVA